MKFAGEPLFKNSKLFELFLKLIQIFSFFQKSKARSKSLEWSIIKRLTLSVSIHKAGDFLHPIVLAPSRHIRLQGRYLRTVIEPHRTLVVIILHFSNPNYLISPQNALF
jgi:hypothetical protein